MITSEIYEVEEYVFLLVEIRMSPLPGHNVLIIFSSPNSDFSLRFSQLKFTAPGNSVNAEGRVISTQKLESDTNLEFIFKHCPFLSVSTNFAKPIYNFIFKACFLICNRWILIATTQSCCED